MRAEVISELARARNWQSQRVTRRSLTLAALGSAGTAFHPVPSHNGQTSAGALITWRLFLHSRLLLRLCTRGWSLRKAQVLTSCVHPVQEWKGLWRVEEKRSGSSAKPLGKPQSGRRACETGFRRGFSQLT